MKIFLSTIIFIFSVQSLSNADDIRDFQIEGYSVGDKLSKTMSKQDIKESTIPYFQDKRKYYIVK